MRSKQANEQCDLGAEVQAKKEHDGRSIAVHLPKRWWSRVAAAAGALVLIYGAVGAGEGLYRLGAATVDEFQPGNPYPPPSAAGIQQSLNASQAPAPGSSSPVLGFGDSLGGRHVISYLPQNGLAGITTPTLNSLVDLKYGIGDEREFVRASAISNPEHYSPRNHVVRLTVGPIKLTSTDPYLDIWVYLDNNALPQSNCSVLSGNTVASGVALRGAIWRAPNGSWDVVRFWVSSLNASPQWMTDAVLVNTPPGASLRMLPQAGAVYREVPRLANDPISSAVFAGAGTNIATGYLGACWSNREVVFIVLRTTG